MSIAGNSLSGDDLALLAVVPRADTPDRLVGLVSGTGLPGLRSTDRLNYFTSGVGFPEVTVLRAAIWRDGFSGVEGAGDLAKVVWRTGVEPK